MTEINASESPANSLCKACGLCCTGHLFSWTKLRSAELDVAEEMGLKVLRSIPSQRGFNQPCPLWQGQCTIYSSPSYPHFCSTYKCTLLKKVLDETVLLSEALNMIRRAKAMVQEVEAMLPKSMNPNFRERLVARLEDLENQKGTGVGTDREFRQKANELIIYYEKVFGVNDIVETLPGE